MIKKTERDANFNQSNQYTLPSSSYQPQLHRYIAVRFIYYTHATHALVHYYLVQIRMALV